MKKKSLILVALAASIALGASVARSQRGGGGGRAGGAGGGGGGAAAAAGRAGAAVNRSPSMSRPSVGQPSAGNRPSVGQGSAASQPSRPTTGQRPAVSQPAAASRPSVGQQPSAGQPAAPSRPGVGQLPTNPAGGASPRPGPPSAGTRPNIDRGKLQNSIGVGAGQQPSMPDWFKPGVSPLPSERPSVRPPATGEPPSVSPPIAGQRPSVRPPTTGQPPTVAPPIVGKPPVAIQPVPPIARPPVVPPGVRPPARYPPLAGPPRWPWYPGHPGYPGYRPGYWWGWATAATLTRWVVFAWPQPIYYRYGTGGNVYYQNNMVYIDNRQYCTAAQYYEQASAIASSAPKMDEPQAEKVQWMPLGVFAITADNVNASSMYLQLAVSKDGMIAGTFYNESTGAVHPVEGMVDQKTQRAAWKAADGTNANLVMETGIYDLTENQASMLVHFGPDETQTALLVRLEEPKQQEAGAAEKK